MKIIKQGQSNIYKRIIDICSITQICSFLYAFACVFYWFLSLAQAPFISSISFLFEPVFNIVKLFYVQKTIDIEKSDMSGIIAAIIFIIIAIIAKIIKEQAILRQEILRIELEKQSKLDDLNAQKQIEQEYINEMKKYDKFIVLVDFKIQPIKSYMFDNTTSEDEIKDLKVKLMAELFSSVSGDYIIQKSKYQNDYFYIIGKIQKTSECLHVITSTIHEMSRKYGHLNITMSYDLSFDAISIQTVITEKLEFLKKVIQLNYNDSMLTTSLFKTCYELISKSTMNFSVLGTFQFQEKNKSYSYELYSAKKIN